MSVRQISRVWDDERIPGGADLLVMLALADRADDHGRCWPGMHEIAAKARLTVRGARQVIARLERIGLLERRIGGGRHRSSHYVLLPDKPGTTVPGNGVDKPGTAVQGFVDDDAPPWAEKPGTAVPGMAVSDDPENTAQPCRDIQRYPAQPCPKPGTAVPGNRQEPSKTPPPDSARDQRDPEVDALWEAAGLDPSKRVPQPWMDIHVLQARQRWTAAGLTFAEVVQVVRHVAQGRRERGDHRPPATPAYFDRAIAETAHRKANPPKLTPIDGGKNHEPRRRPTLAERRAARAEEELASDIEFARSLDRARRRGGEDA